MDLLDKNLNKAIKCALTDEGHFLTRPITLLCAHAVCHDCIDSLIQNDLTIVKCELCRKVNKIDLNIIAESVIASSLITKSIIELFSAIRNRFDDSFKKFKGRT